MSRLVYDSTSDIRFHPVAGGFTLLLGLGLGAWYVRDITTVIAGDAKNFHAAFVESPIPTLLFVVFKICAYVFFAALFGLMIYVPARNLFLRRVVSGHLVEVLPKDGADSNKLVLNFSSSVLSVPRSVDLEAALAKVLPQNLEVKVTLGAFNRVIRVEQVT